MFRRHLSTVPEHSGQTGVAKDGRGRVIQRRGLATWTKIFHLLRVISDKVRVVDGGPTAGCGWIYCLLQLNH